jgi:hypothetical protein
MRVSGVSRFTALLAAVAIVGMAGTFWWALETRSDMKAAADNRAASRSLPPKFGGRVTRSKDEQPSKFEPHKFELMGKSERPQPGSQVSPLGSSPGRSEDQDQGPDRPTPSPWLAIYPNPGAAPKSALQSPASQSQSFQSHASSSPADMPLPALPALTRPDPSPWQAIKAPDPPTLLPLLPAPPLPAENPKRQAREQRPPPPAAARSPKPPAPSYYTEKFVEDGEYRYRRRVCEPPNMPDVCFMPQSDRQPIVVAKPQ